MIQTSVCFKSVFCEKSKYFRNVKPENWEILVKVIQIKLLTPFKISLKTPSLFTDFDQQIEKY